MQRLTFNGNFCDIAMCAETPCKYPDGGCTQKQVWEQLKAYEVTGLEPDEVDQIRLAAKAMMFSSVGDFVRYSIANFEELEKYRKAEREGRLVVLPCKVGDTVYCIKDSVVEEGWGVKKAQPYIITDTFLAHMAGVVGKTVFLTREAAEAKLREMEADNGTD